MGNKLTSMHVWSNEKKLNIKDCINHFILYILLASCHPEQFSMCSKNTHVRTQYLYVNNKEKNEM